MTPEEKAREIIERWLTERLSLKRGNDLNPFIFDIEAALRQSSEEGERRGREEAAKVAEESKAGSESWESACRKSRMYGDAEHYATAVSTAAKIAAAIRSLNSPTPTEGK